MTQVRSTQATSTPIGPYERLQAEVHEWDPRTVEAAARVAELVREHRPDLAVEHIGSTAVPGLPGKGIVDLSIETEPADIPAVVAMLYDLGFSAQPGPDPWPPTRPMPVGSLDVDGHRFRIHLHVQPIGGDYPRDLAFRDALRNDSDLRSQYEGLKRGITDAGPVEGLRYTHSKTAWILQVYRRLGFAPPPIAPPSTIGIIGGGQLGRMLALAGRELGYRAVVLDPDPEAPAASVADRLEIGAYDDVGAALRMAEGCAVITYELEHVGPAVVAALDDRARPIRPGPYPLKLTADRLAERRFVEANEGTVAPWREVSSHADVLEGAAELGYPRAAQGGPRRLRRPKPGPARRHRGHRRGRRSDRAGRRCSSAELEFEAELSVVVVRNVDGVSRTFPVARNRHDRGILIETAVPAGVPESVEKAAATLAENLATSMGLVGTLTVELFLLRDGSIVVNELAPRVHNSGHWSIEGAVTSQFEQHLRAICGLPLGSVEMRSPAVAMVNLLGEGATAAGPPDRHLRGARRPGRPSPPVRQGLGVRAAEDGPRDRPRRDGGGGARPRARDAPATSHGGNDARRSAASSASSVAAARTSRCSRRRSRSSSRWACRASCGSCRRIGRPDHLYRYAESAPGRGIRVIIAGAGGAAHLPGHARREDDPAGHRRADADEGARRPRFAALDRPDAPRDPRRDGRDRERRERRAARGRDPGARGPGARHAARALARRPDRVGARRRVQRDIRR